jgi:hypothetical protein
LRLVFLLYAEDRGLTPGGEVYVNHYSVGGLFEQLRADAGRYPDTMDQRFGAWARLLTLFRLVQDGARHGPLQLPARKGRLFDPDRYPFLEGRTQGSERRPGERLAPPLVPDGVVYRVLEKLLVLDGERLAYRTLAVEQIGSVYETMMGFRLEKAGGRSIAVRPAKAHGAPATVNLDELLTVPAGKRNEWLKTRTDQALTGAALNALKAAQAPEDVVAALGRKVAAAATPRIVPPGAMVLQPSDERRRSGSHYTPRNLTEPIVRTTLRPVLERLGPRPAPAQILALKVCDPAMGSGAFLVEACRQLAEVLVAAWHAHGRIPVIPPDEDELLHARRLVAQRCLYGLDKNPMAVDLAKLSLWLATLAACPECGGERAPAEHDRRPDRPRAGPRLAAQFAVPAVQRNWGSPGRRGRPGGPACPAGGAGQEGLVAPPVRVGQGRRPNRAAPDLGRTPRPRASRSAPPPAVRPPQPAPPCPHRPNRAARPPRRLRRRQRAQQLVLLRRPHHRARHERAPAPVRLAHLPACLFAMVNPPPLRGQCLDDPAVHLPAAQGRRQLGPPRRVAGLRSNTASRAWLRASLPRRRNGQSPRRGGGDCAGRGRAAEGGRAGSPGREAGRRRAAAGPAATERGWPIATRGRGPVAPR